MLVTLLLLASAAPQSGAPEPLVLTGATAIDGTGRAPLADATVVVVNGRIASVGTGKPASLPAGARVLDLRGKFITPGFVNANVHLTPYFAFGEREPTDSALLANALLASRAMLERGVTTLRDSYGILSILRSAGTAAEAAPATYPRILVAGNILGWGGPWSYTFAGSGAEGQVTPWQRRLRTEIVQGMGEGLADLGPDSLRVLLRGYLEKGPHFIKLGVTSHTANPSLLLFSPRSLAALVDEAHRRRVVVDAHAEHAEGVRMAVEAGVDVLQHPETAGGQRLPDDLLELIAARGTVCSLMPAEVTGEAWQAFERHLSLGGRMWPAEMPPDRMASRADSLVQLGIDPTKEPKTASVQRFRNHRANALALVKRCPVVAVATDEVVGVPDPADPDSPRRFGRRFPGALAGLLELGMTPMQALVAATLNGARAAGLAAELGTLEPGKRADILVFAANPLVGWGKLPPPELVLRDGRVVSVLSPPR